MCTSETSEVRIQLTQKSDCSSGFFSFTHFKKFVLHWWPLLHWTSRWINVSSLLKSWHFYKQHGCYVPLFPHDFGHLVTTCGVMEYPSGGERIHNSPRKKKLASVFTSQRMSVLDELKPSMLLLCDMCSVRESNQVWQHWASYRGPAGQYVYMSVCAHNTHMHTHINYVFNHACPTSFLSVTSMGKAFGVFPSLWASLCQSCACILDILKSISV